MSQQFASATPAIESRDKGYKSRLRIFADDFNRDAICHKIHRLYEEKKHLTLNVIHQVLKENDLFEGG